MNAICFVLDTLCADHLGCYGYFRSNGLNIDRLAQEGVLYEGTAIILTSDHGEDLDLHGIGGHATLHETTIAIPRIVRDPVHLPAGAQVKGCVQHADHVPTILEYFPEPKRPHFERLATADPMPGMPAAFDRENLRELVHGQRQAPKEIVVESGEHRAYLVPPWKLIWHKSSRRSELYHLDNDPPRDKRPGRGGTGDRQRP